MQDRRCESQQPGQRPMPFRSAACVCICSWSQRWTRITGVVWIPQSSPVSEKWFHDLSSQNIFMRCRAQFSGLTMQICTYVIFNRYLIFQQSTMCNVNLQKLVVVRNDYLPQTNIAKLFIQGILSHMFRELIFKNCYFSVPVTNFRDYSKHMEHVLLLDATFSASESWDISSHGSGTWCFKSLLMFRKKVRKVQEIVHLF